MFKVGDLAVYPAHGVGVIEAVETKELSGEKKSFYVMRLLENDLVIMIPIDNVQRVRMRPLIPKDKIYAVYDVLKDGRKPSFNGTTPNRRYREFMEKLKSGSIYATADVLRNLALIREEKNLSFSEKKILETAKRLIIQELSLAQGCSEKIVYSEIRQILHL